MGLRERPGEENLSLTVIQLTSESAAVHERYYLDVDVQTTLLWPPGLPILTAVCHGFSEKSEVFDQVVRTKCSKHAAHWISTYKIVLSLGENIIPNSVAQV